MGDCHLAGIGWNHGFEQRFPEQQYLGVFCDHLAVLLVFVTVIGVRGEIDLGGVGVKVPLSINPVRKVGVS